MRVSVHTVQTKRLPPRMNSGRASRPRRAPLVPTHHPPGHAPRPPPTDLPAALREVNEKKVNEMDATRRSTKKKVNEMDATSL